MNVKQATPKSQKVKTYLVAAYRVATTGVTA